MGLGHEFIITDCKYNASNQRKQRWKRGPDKWRKVDMQGSAEMLSLNGHPWEIQINEGEALLETRLALQLAVKAWQAANSRG